MTAAPTICLVDVCLGNLRSVERALIAAGANVVRTSDPDVVRTADKLVVPGQGAFGPFMQGIQKHGMDQALRQTIDRGAQYLGICLGMQVLFDQSEEGNGVAGLGLISGGVHKIPAMITDTRLKIPHMGWNQVSAPPHSADAGSHRLLRGIAQQEHFYFVHSYVVKPNDPRHVALTFDYGDAFCAAVAKDNLFACQFHPEKSQRAGLHLLRNFVEYSL
jgi:imidazole glycerol-phosphate synthase subunit HisH